MSEDQRMYYGIAPVKSDSAQNIVGEDIYDAYKSIGESEAAWQNWFYRQSPNGAVLQKHNLFEEIDARGELTLLHITTAYGKMQQSGLVYPSGGSLGCTVYCVPLRLDGTMHNLTKFILNYELPMSLRARGLTEKTKVDMLAIRVARDSIAAMDKAANAMDHLLLGELQADAYDQFILDAKVDVARQNKLELVTLKKIQQNIEFLNLCNKYYLHDVSNDEFFDGMYRLLESIGFFGYVYFETLIEYLALYQSDAESAVLKQIGEINSNSKRLIFEIAPHLLSSFRLPTFRPTVQELIKYLKNVSQEKKLVLDFDPHVFEEFIKWRFAQNIRYKVMRGHKIDDVPDFMTMRRNNSSLLGHVIRTEVGTMHELQDVAPIYDIARANLIRDGWNKYRVLFPYNAIVPKGEVGINPSFPNLSYKVLKTSFDSRTGIVSLGRELPLKLATELIDPQLSTLRFQLAKK